MNSLMRIFSLFPPTSRLRLLSVLDPNHELPRTSQTVSFQAPPRRFESTNPTEDTKRRSKADAVLAGAVDAEGPQSDDFYESSVVPLTEEEILAKRDKSKLRQLHQHQIHGLPPDPNMPHWTHLTVKFKKRMFGRHGERSGTDPRILWPTHEELKRRLDYERIAYPFTFQEMAANVKEKRRLEREYFVNRALEVETKMKTVNKLIQEVLNKKAAKELEALKVQERKAKLVEEVRRHFGYTVDPKDERFQAMIEKKEKEERKKLKEARKLEKQAKMMAKLAQTEEKRREIKTGDSQDNQGDQDKDTKKEESKKKEKVEDKDD